MDELKRAIKISLAYAQKFKMELSLDELWQRLISRQIFDKKEVENAAKEMGLNLKKRKREEMREKMKKAEKILREVADNDKNILFLGITGSVAGGNPKKNDDIDVMAICKRNRLWWCRWKLINFLKKRGIKYRKAGKKEERNAFCFNLWIEEKNLTIPFLRQNKKTALDLILMRPIINIEKNYEKFLEKNSWVKKWVATGYKNIKIGKIKKKIKNEENFILALVNFVMFWGQYVYMKRKMKGEIVNLRQAFFHRK